MRRELINRLYEVIFWLGLGLTLLWYILKSVGIIQTPLWLELLPYAALIFSAGAVFQKVNYDIQTLKSDVHSLKNRTAALEKDVTLLRTSA